MTKRRIIDRWIEARKDLGIDVVGPVEIKISENLTVQADILVKDFGGPRGTIGVEHSAHLQRFAADIWEAGYGLSEFGPPGEDSTYNRESIIECLGDWGWSGPEDRKPKWLDRIRIILANDGPRFCAEIFRDENCLGRVCEIEESDQFALEFDNEMDGNELRTAIEDAKSLLREHRLD